MGNMNRNEITFSEYPGKQCACFKPGTPNCGHTAVIPTLVVENKEGVKGLTNCLVHIADIRTTLYIDDKGRQIITWAGPVEAKGYDFAENPLGLRGQMVFDFDNNKGAYYDATGAYRTFTITEE